jgi:hypothetical protein
MRTFMVVLAIAANGFAASPLIVGGRGGLPVTENSNFFSSALGTSTRSYTIGPTAGVRLPLGFSVEGDALFNRQTLNLPLGLSTHVDSWEFPVMLKLTPGDSTVAPVFGAGMSFRRNDGLSNIPSVFLSGSTSRFEAGFVAGGGLRFRAGPIDITPEVRYTRWNRDSLAESLLNVLTQNRNQVQFLVGFTF